MTDLLELLAIANRAADVARDLFATTRPGRLTEKTDRDYATELDYAVERKLREFLGRPHPRHRLPRRGGRRSRPEGRTNLLGARSS